MFGFHDLQNRRVQVESAAVVALCQNAQSGKILETRQRHSVADAPRFIALNPLSIRVGSLDCRTRLRWSSWRRVCKVLTEKLEVTSAVLRIVTEQAVNT